MKIWTISDIHRQHNFLKIPENIDVVIHAGDSTNYYQIIHQELENNFRFEGLNALERLILIYRSEIMSIQIKEKLGEDYVSIIQLPEPNQPLFERIIAGRAEYSDYKLVENQ